MSVLIAIGIKYLILMEGKIYLIENQETKLLGLFGFKKIVCKTDDVFFAFKATKVKFWYQGVLGGYTKWD